MAKKRKTSKGRKSAVRKGQVVIRGAGGAELADAIKDILGARPKEVTIEFSDKLGPGGTRLRAGEGDWDGNIYKYRY